MEVGHNISASSGMWDFGNNVPDTFVDHISLSVPMYKEGQEIVCDLSEFFMKPNQIHYELGCSTGELTKMLAERHYHKENAVIVGLDSQISMIEKAKAHCAGAKSIRFEHANIIDYNFDKTDFITSYYCIQFISPSVRQSVIDKIYESLNWGGAFVLFEKVRSPDARFQDIANNWYNSFKLKNGFTPEQILSKAESLKTVLEPFSTQGNIDILKRAGFKDITTIMKAVCFEGFLAIK